MKVMFFSQPDKYDGFKTKFLGFFMPSIRLNVVWKQARIEKALKLYFTSFTHVESPQT